MRRLLFVAPLTALFIINCGMSDEKFMEKIQLDVHETCALPYHSGYGYIIQKSRELNAIPEAESVENLLDQFNAEFNNPQSDHPLIMELKKRINEYPGARRKQARFILMSSAAYSFAYGEVLALGALQTAGKTAWLTEMSTDIALEFTDEFFMQNAFPVIYVHAVPKIKELDARLLMTGVVMNQYSTWLMVEALTQ